MRTNSLAPNHRWLRNPGPPCACLRPHDMIVSCGPPGPPAAFAPACIALSSNHPAPAIRFAAPGHDGHPHATAARHRRRPSPSPGYHRDDRHVRDHRPAHTRTCPSGKRKRRWKAGSVSIACGGRPSRSAPSSRRACCWPSRSRSHSSNPALGRPSPGGPPETSSGTRSRCGFIHRTTRASAGDPAEGGRARVRSGPRRSPGHQANAPSSIGRRKAGTNALRWSGRSQRAAGGGRQAFHF